MRGASNGSVTAKKEVVIAAGAVHTPQILQLSGLGDARYLERLGIESVVDLPGVGQTLQYHLVLKVKFNCERSVFFYRYTILTNAPGTSNHFPNGGSLQSNATYAAEQRALYNASKPSAYGLTTTTGNLLVQLPLANWTGDSSAIIKSAESQDFVALLGESPDPTVLRGFKKQRKAMPRNINSAVVGGLSWNTGPETSIYMTRPFSRGSVKVNSTSILEAPLIDYGALTDSTDLEILYAIYMKNWELMSTPDMAVLGPIETAPAPGIDDASTNKDAIMRALAPSNAHQCCTAAMMRREDGGVVDAQNRVYGTNRLSVVDASLWPLVVGGGPQASVFAGAEKAADLIKARHGLL